MAGIGFRLQKLLREDTYTGLLKGYLYSAVISSGPMLSSIICIGLLGVLSLPVLNTEDYLLFRTTIVYIFAFSLIFTGFFQMATTRYLADRLYSREPHALIPCCIGLMMITIVCQSIIGVIVFYQVIPDWQYVVLATSLYIIISCLWNIMMFISATRNYTLITVGFFLGSVISLVVGQTMGLKFGLFGYLFGFTLGQLTIVVFLMASFFKEYDFFHVINFKFMRYFRKYPDLCVAGIVINIAIWVDKMMFWFSPYGERIVGFFHSFPPYDGAFFIAYLSIVPALSLFLVRIETSFSHKYRYFYQNIMGKSPLKNIETAKDRIIEDLKDSIQVLLKVQGFITILFISGAVTIMKMAKLSWLQIVMFKIGTLSAFLLILFQFLLIIMFYFELRREAMVLTIVFFVTNIVATGITISMGIRSFGYGFFAATFASLFIGYFLLNYKLTHLEYLTFTFQPIQKVSD